MKRLVREAMAAAIIASIGGLLSGCTDKAAPSVASAAPVAAPQSEAEPEKIEPPKPDHRYAMKEDGEYGYERALSDNDRKAGRATSALLMVRYLGEKNGVRSVKMIDGDYTGIISCSPPCQFVKARTYFAGRLIKTETVPVTDGSLIRAVMADAISGQLDVYGKQGS